MTDPALTKGEILNAITSSNEDAKKQFIWHFAEEVDRLSAALARVHARFVLVNERVPPDGRSGWTQAFLYSAFDSIVSSAQLLVYGHHVAAGNLVRSWAEAAAVALLFSSDQLGAFDSFIANPQQFSASKAFYQLQRRDVRKQLSLNVEGLERFKTITDFYNLHSHASPWAVSSRKVFHQENAFALAGEFDQDKLDYYRREIRLLISAAGQLFHMIEAAEQSLRSRKNASDELVDA